MESAPENQARSGQISPQRVAQWRRQWIDAVPIGFVIDARGDCGARLAGTGHRLAQFKAQEVHGRGLVLVLALQVFIGNGIDALAACDLDPAAALHAFECRKLLRAFGAFWREHGAALLGATPYHEVAAQLVFMAFLQRIVNGGGHVDREYGVGRGRRTALLRLSKITSVPRRNPSCSR